MSRTFERQAWADFWTIGGGAGCLPSAGHPIGQAQRAVWEDFAKTLATGARILDIGSGDGAALAHFARARSDLKLIGVDSSPSLPPAGHGILLMPNVEAESLPFEESSFDAVISQFGFEYADTAKASTEAARVLRPGGAIRLMIHRRDSAVVEHNLGRREALRWALECGQLEKGRAAIETPAADPRVVPSDMRATFTEAQRLFPNQTVAAEFTAAVIQAITAFRDSRQANARLDSLAAKAKSEIARLDALDRAARDRAGIEALLTELRAADMCVEAVESLEEMGTKRPFAWQISGSRR